MTQRRLLVVRVGAMGDVLHALPAVSSLRRHWPEAEIDWVIDPRWAPLLADPNGTAPVVSRVHLAPTKLWSAAPVSRSTIRSLRGLRRALRDGRYDTVVDMQGTLRSAVISHLAGSPKTAGFADPREAPATWFYTHKLPRTGTHVVQQGAALLGEALNLTLAPEPSALPHFFSQKAWAKDLLWASSGERPVAVLAPTAGWGAKEWPPDRFGEMARELKRQGWKVLVNAARADDAVVARVVAASDAAAQPVVCDVASLIELLRQVTVVVGGDTGPVHLAAALGTPVVGLYGPTDPARNGPWGPGLIRVLRDPASVTSHKRAALVEAGLARLTVAEVLRAVEQLASLASREKVHRF